MCFIDLGQSLKRGFLFLKYVSEYMYTLHFMIVLINKISGSERELTWFKKARDFIPFTTLWFVSLHFPQRLFHNTGQQHLHTGVSTLDRLSLSCAAVILVHKSPLWYCAIVAALWGCLSCKPSIRQYFDLYTLTYFAGKIHAGTKYISDDLVQQCKTNGH